MNKTLLFLLLSCSVVILYGQSSLKDAEKKANDYATELGLKENIQRNIRVDKSDVIHVFMFEDGNLLLSGYPTTALEDNKFQLHLYTSKTHSYRLEIVGVYEPSLFIDKAIKQVPLNSSLERIDFAILGPFTGAVTFILKHSENGTDFTPINSSTVKIAKTIHASVGTGFVFSTLRNPTNVRVVPLDNNSGNSTLIADNPEGNANLALMATLYPWGRNSLMLNSRRLKDRMGIVVGTSIASSEKNFKNLYCGLHYDFSYGGSIVVGVDIAERQRIQGIDYENFKFGESIFTGTLDNRLYQKVGAGFFFGVQIDSRILSNMFAAYP